MTEAMPTISGRADCLIRAGMVLVPAGPFEMGSATGGEFERPVHTVTLENFWIDQSPVTNAEFATFVDSTGWITSAERAGSAWGYRDGHFAEVAGLCWRAYATQERQDHPVILVSWEDAASFAAWAGKRLPTEAEWEKAARGGIEGTLYPWGSEEPTPSDAIFARAPADFPPTSPKRNHIPNGYGLYDMVGNVWQWCSDWYSGDYYEQSPRHNPTGPTSGTLRVRRGASWNIIQTFRLRCANRGAVRPDTAVPNTGFRCVITKL